MPRPSRIDMTLRMKIGCRQVAGVEKYINAIRMGMSIEPKIVAMRTMPIEGRIAVAKPSSITAVNAAGMAVAFPAAGADALAADILSVG